MFKVCKHWLCTNEMLYKPVLDRCVVHFKSLHSPQDLRHVFLHSQFLSGLIRRPHGLWDRHARTRPFVPATAVAVDVPAACP